MRIIHPPQDQERDGYAKSEQAYNEDTTENIEHANHFVPPSHIPLARGKDWYAFLCSFLSVWTYICVVWMDSFVAEGLLQNPHAFLRKVDILNAEAAYFRDTHYGT